MIYKTKTILCLIAAGALGLVLSPAAKADLITGTITFNGGATLDQGEATATEVTSITDFEVQSFSGSFVGEPGIAVNSAVTTNVAPATPWVFAPSTAFNNLWSVGGFTFNLAGSTVALQDATDLIVHGSGTISGNGFTATGGTFSFSIVGGSGSGGVFSFTAATTALPDGGATVALLGFALIGIEGLRRKLMV